MLSKMSSRRGLCGAALEIDHGNDLQMVAVSAMRNVFRSRPAILVEVATHIQQLFSRVGTTAGRCYHRLRSLAFERQVLQVAAGDAKVLRCFRKLEWPERFLGIRREHRQAMLVQHRGQIVRLLRDQQIDFSDLLFEAGFDIHRYFPHMRFEHSSSSLTACSSDSFDPARYLMLTRGYQEAES